MKKTFFLIFVIFFITCLFSYSQNEWAPIGAKWYYNRYPGTGFEMTTIESIGDTIINSKTCKKLKVLDIRELMESSGAYYWDTVAHVNEYLYYESNKIYHYDRYLNYFYKLYDFSPQINDTILVRDTTYLGCNMPSYYCSTFKYIVDSISNEVISNMNFTKIYTKPTIFSNWVFSSQASIDNFPIIEKLGSTKYFFGIFNAIPLEGDIYCLRCYIDSNINYKASSWADTLPCNYLRPLHSSNNISNPNFNPSIVVYPNPVNNYLNINVPKNIKYVDIYLYDMFGRKKNIEIENIENGVKINVENISTGLLLLNIVTDMYSYNYIVRKF